MYIDKLFHKSYDVTLYMKKRERKKRIARNVYVRYMKFFIVKTPNIQILRL